MTMSRSATSPNTSSRSPTVLTTSKQEVAEKEERIDELEQRVDDLREDKADKAKAHRKAIARKTQFVANASMNCKPANSRKVPICLPRTSTKSGSLSKETNSNASRKTTGRPTSDCPVRKTRSVAVVQSPIRRRISCRSSDFPAMTTRCSRPSRIVSPTNSQARCGVNAMKPVATHSGRKAVARFVPT